MSIRHAAVSVCWVVAQLAWLTPTADAVPLYGTSFTGPQGAILYDVDPLTGQATLPRATGIDNLVGVAFAGGPGAPGYGLSNGVAATNPNTLFSIDPITGAAEVVGPTGLSNVIEGDLAFDPTSGQLYGLHNLASGQRQLFTLDTQTGAATVRPQSLAGDPSAMAFDAAGMLYVIDTLLQTLLTVDETTGATLASTPLSLPLGSVAGMDVDPASGTFYVADGGSGGTDQLYTLNVATGVLTPVGPTTLDTGLAGLAFLPEPTTLAMLALGAVGVIRRRNR